MSFFMTKLLRRKIVPVIKIDGPITELVVDVVTKHLKNIPAPQSQALGIVLNSSGGSPVQCNILRTKLQIYSKKHNLPLYMFTERHALSGGYYIMTGGDQLIIHESGVLGNLGVQNDFQAFKQQVDPNNLDNFDYNEKTYEYSYDLFEGIKNPKEKKMTEKILDSFNKKIIYDSNINRNTKNQDVIMNKIHIGKQAVELGLADQIGTYQEFIRKEHPNCKIQCHISKSKFEAFAEKTHKYAVLMKSRAFFIVLGLFGLKVLVKWTLIIYFWKKSRDSKKEEKKKQREEQEKLQQEQEQHQQ